jgi:hypothetical protein
LIAGGSLRNWLQGRFYQLKAPCKRLSNDPARQSHTEMQQWQKRSEHFAFEQIMLFVPNET